MLGFLETPKTVKSNLITLQQDNHEKISVTVDRSYLTTFIKRKKKWRKGDMIKRFFELGSKEFDQLINELNNELR